MVINYENLIADQIDRIKNSENGNDIIDFINDINDEPRYGTARD